MRKVTVLMLGLAVSGCADGGCADFLQYAKQSLTPWEPANAPIGDSETFQRVRGQTVSAMPVLPQTGDIWPGAPEPVPSLQDVSNPDSAFNRMFPHSLDHLNADLKMQLGDGEAVSVGEESARQNGIRRSSVPYQEHPIGAPLPSSVPDAAPSFLEKADSTVAIPNGDGTTTLIAPDGSIRIVRGMPAHVAAHGKKHAVSKPAASPR